MKSPLLNFVTYLNVEIFKNTNCHYATLLLENTAIMQPNKHLDK